MVNRNLKKVTQQVRCMHFDSHHVTISDWCGVILDRDRGTINTLSDDELLCIFDCYVTEAPQLEAWHTLVHVCQRWRHIVFGSPRGLNLRIACKNNMPVRNKLDVWPALPIAIFADFYWGTCGLNNIKAAFEFNERVSQIDLVILRHSLDDFDVFAALEKPFPALTDLKLQLRGSPDPIFPDLVKFLDGSTRLRSLSLTFVPMPGLPKLLLSSTGLINLHLDNIPVTGFLSPEAIITGLAALTRLKVLHLNFKFDPSHPDWENRRLPLPTRTVLPSLTVLKFKGVNEYLEDFMARIDAPLLDHLTMTFDCPDFDLASILLNAQHLSQFISRTPKLQAPVKAHIGMDTYTKISIKFSGPTQISSVVRLRIHCIAPEWRFPCLGQFCRSPFFPLATLEELYFSQGFFPQRDDRNTRCLELFRPFTSVKNLYISEEYTPVVRKLIGEGAAGVLPTLENVFLESFQPFGPVPEAIEQLIAARQLSGRPIVVSRWDRTRRDEI